MNHRAILVGALGLVLATASGVGAQGSGKLAGHGTLGARGCRHDRSSFTVSLAVNAGGTWDAVQSDGPSFSGTWTARGRKGRVLKLAFDPASEEALKTVVAGDVALLCDITEPVTITSAVAKTFTLTLTRKGRRAALLLRYVVKGRAGGRSGTARETIRASGPWTPAG